MSRTEPGNEKLKTQRRARGQKVIHTEKTLKLTAVINTLRQNENRQRTKENMNWKQVRK